MNIYFSAAIRGGRAEQPTYKIIAEALATHGTVLTDHIADETLTQRGETELTDKEIYMREMERIGSADIVVTELSVPSLGVGYVLGRALQLKKTVLAVYQGAHSDNLSAMIKGDARITVVTYQTDEELVNAIDAFFKNN
ncbi:MAG: nucleoside 2-deoxyribosyltransferase [Candidatus Magasanikbacteria bacterium CG10_big_fil_rev_8_21_14_0_10_43_6]|uniref:Putative 2'-deoxynucleoside 5'-phosphate N-hydrolase 1 n=1 Tax=Candidatus Magasanikbacteria bacterium CG10_big_fil_rev_8_21_14_0_10_43_6 TaxID=1974650 RepID=A0A2M6W0I7_9BACT|nr:MAG: nucleoside 2-deoxyribosyltransferase [Candidatus Magasanikbacteria bacterium CG10_big_fil_rev_8_21_14_0_10_43_6]